MAGVTDSQQLARPSTGGGAAGPVSLVVTFSRPAFLAATGAFLLIGAVPATYGPLLTSFTQRFHLSLASAGVALSVHFAGACLGVLSAVAGFERAPGSRVSAAALLTLGIGCAVVATAGSWSMLLLGVLLAGFAFGMLDFGLNQLMTRSRPEGRSRRLNVMGAGYGVGAVLSPLTIAALGGRMATTVVFLVTGVAAVLLSPLLRGISAPPIRDVVQTMEGSRWQRAGLTRLVGVFVLAYILYVAVEAATSGWLAAHLSGLGYSTRTAAGTTAGFWVAVTVGRLLAAAVAQRVTAAAIVVGCAALSILTLALTALTPAAPVGYLLTGLLLGPIFPTGLAWLANAGPGNPRTISWLLTGTMVGGIVGPAAAGVLVGQGGVRLVPLATSLLAVATAVTFAAIAGRARLGRRVRAPL